MSKNKAAPGAGTEPAAKKQKLASSASAPSSSPPTPTSSSGVKTDPLELRFIQLCQLKSQGVSEADLKSEFDDIPISQLATLVNNMMAKQRITIFENAATKELIYKLVDSAEADKLRELSREEMMVYQLVKQSENVGIWIKDIRTKSGLPSIKGQDQVNKILKTLTQRKMIKQERSIEAVNKHVYMLYHLEPSKKISGGCFYSGHEFDPDFTQLMYQWILTYLKQEGKGSVESCHDYVVRQNENREKIIKNTDVAALLVSMAYDGVIERMSQREISESKKKAADLSAIWYKYVRAGSYDSAYTHIPCSVCPVADRCVSGGVVSPQTCTYIKDWMNLI